PASAAMADFRTRLAAAKQPLVVVGGSGWSDGAAADLARFVAANNLPVAASFRRQDILDNDLPNYVGDVGLGPNPKLAARVQASDLLIFIGARLSENMTGGYKLLSPPRLPHKMIHVHQGTEELGKVFAPDL